MAQIITKHSQNKKDHFFQTNHHHHPSSRLDRDRSSPDQPLPLSLRRAPPRSPSPPPPAHHHPHHRYPPDPHLSLPPRGLSITPPDSDSPPAAFLVSPEALRCRLCEFQVLYCTTHTISHIFNLLFNYCNVILCASLLPGPKVGCNPWIRSVRVQLQGTWIKVV